MIITCPDCETRYQIKSGSLKAPGQRVRCQNCESMWFQEPEEDRLQPTPEERAEIASQDENGAGKDDLEDNAKDAATEPGDKSPPIDIETEAARLIAISQDARQKRRRKKTQIAGALTGWVMMAACVCVFVASGIIWRKPIVKMFPVAADLYAAVYTAC